MNHYLALTKPRITWLILMSTGIGYFFGHRGPLDPWLLLNTLLGTALLASGTATLNQWYERDADARMHRTESRPIPSGLVTPLKAFLFGLTLIVLGEVELALGVNGLTAWIGFATVGSYLLLYTPMKRRTWLSTTVGAFPGAMPPLIGFAAARGALTLEAWVLFAIIFLWQFPHFYSIAWMYKDDYARAGIRMLPVVEPDGVSTSRHILAFALLLLPVSLLPGFLNMTGHWYLAAALLLGAFFLRSAVRVACDRTLPNARLVLKASVIYLPLLYVALVLDRHVGL
ncbi:MAG: heme o synthase [Bryobacteraceae bacterium]|nr:heme o synthase [Bryobacteraceae bacterium]